MHRALAILVLAAACGNHHHHGVDADGAALAFIDAPCVGLACFQVNCAPKGLPPTTIAGTVYAPNGTLPLYGVSVYIPATDPGALGSGASCARCSDKLPG